jgi:hypothetical protein
VSATIVETHAYDAHRTVLIDSQDRAWVTFCAPWWDLASWVWWWLTPGKASWLVVDVRRGERVIKARVHAKRVGRKTVHLGGA